MTSRSLAWIIHVVSRPACGSATCFRFRLGGDSFAVDDRALPVTADSDPEGPWWQLSADRNHGKGAVNVAKVARITGEQRRSDGHGHRSDEQIEPAGLRVSTRGSHAGAQVAVRARRLRPERDRVKRTHDPLVSLFSCGVDERVGGVQAIDQLGKGDVADRGGFSVARYLRSRIIDDDGRDTDAGSAAAAPPAHPSTCRSELQVPGATAARDRLGLVRRRA